MNIASRTLVTALCIGTSAAFAAGHAHVHGVAKLDVAVEAGGLTVQMESPLDNLLGFERAPRNDAERRQADAVVAKLRSAAAMFSIDPAAQCKPAHVELSSSALKLGHPDPKEEEQGHADIDGSFEFTCVDATKASYIDVGLFEFARLQKLEVQVATPHRQFKRDLKRPARRIVLTK
jgi:hypothetical protein